MHSFSHGSMALVSLGLHIVEVSRSHSDTPHSVGLLWTSDRLVADTSTWQHPTTGRIRTRYPSNRVAADPHLRLRDHWDPPTYTTV